jgi:hypothetical protein
MEGSSTGEFLLTLRGRHTFVALPELKLMMVPSSHRQAVVAAFGKFREDVHRASAISVIDRARDVASAALSAYLQDLGVVPPGRDLGDLIKKLNSLDGGQRRHLVASTAEILRVLHSRAKPAVQERMSVPDIHEQDGQLAIHCVGNLLCELGWAEWR